MDCMRYMQVQLSNQLDYKFYAQYNCWIFFRAKGTGAALMIMTVTYIFCRFKNIFAPTVIHFCNEHFFIFSLSKTPQKSIDIFPDDGTPEEEIKEVRVSVL